MRTVRAAAADAAEESNKRVSVFATAPHKPTQILNKAPDTVVASPGAEPLPTPPPERSTHSSRAER